jgi:hypothetical protein
MPGRLSEFDLSGSLPWEEVVSRPKLQPHKNHGRLPESESHDVAVQISIPPPVARSAGSPQVANRT